MRDPATDLDIKELTELAIQYLCERELLELNEAINRNFAISRSFLKRPKPWGWRPPARKRGRPAQRRNLHLQIAGAIAMLVEDEGPRPTRSHASRRRRDPSACSIVTAALEQVDLSDYLGGERRGKRLSERSVEEIWNQHRLSPQIFHQGATDFARNHRYRISSRIIPGIIRDPGGRPPC
jgi:hypothetical protein